MRRPPLRLLDRYFVYHPAPWIDRDWARWSGLPLQDVSFTSTDGTRLFGWYVEPPTLRAALLWCHGNAGNIIDRLDNLSRLYAAGFAVFLFDYRGYGRSEGLPTEAGLYRDADAAYRELLARVQADRVVIFGRSLGAGVAGDVAAKHPAAGLILESCFPSVPALARFHYHGFPVDWLLRARFPLAERVREIRVPLLFTHGDRDELVPLELGRRVFEAANPPKTLYVVAGANHNDTYVVGGRPYFQRLVAFAEDCVRP
jgi:uncharacterized protein